MKAFVHWYCQILQYIKGRRLWALLTLLLAAEFLVFCLLNSEPSSQYGKYVVETQPLYTNLLSFVLFENLQACLSILASGVIPLGIGALFTCYGMMDGLVSTGKWLLPDAGGWKMALCLIPHGVFEIPAMIISVMNAILLSRAVTVAIWRLIIRKSLKAELLYEMKMLLQITIKGPNKQSAKKTLAHKALILIGQIYAMDEKGADLSGAARTEYRQWEVAPLVEAYFAWVKEHRDHVPAKSETGEGFTYSLNQEAYLKVFLTDGSIPLDNSASERAIRPFTVGRKNWMMIDTEHGAKASAMIYSLVETAKANHLKPYEYLKHLLTEIPKHMDDTNTDFVTDLLSWSATLLADCRKSV